MKDDFTTQIITWTQHFRVSYDWKIYGCVDGKGIRNIPLKNYWMFRYKCYVIHTQNRKCFAPKLVQKIQNTYVLLVLTSQRYVVNWGSTQSVVVCSCCTTQLGQHKWRWQIWGPVHLMAMSPSDIVLNTRHITLMTIMECHCAYFSCYDPQTEKPGTFEYFVKLHT